jgi:hypothetical protein
MDSLIILVLTTESDEEDVCIMKHPLFINTENINTLNKEFIIYDFI